MKLIIEGKIIHGRKYGRKIGYPTANLDRRGLRDIKGKLPAGVYAGLVWRNKKAHKAAIVVLPVDRRQSPKIEAHLINFKGNLYKKRLRLEFKKFIRPFKKFSNEEKLIEQIDKDVKKILDCLS